MAIYVPGFNPFKSLLISICNIPYAADNLITKIRYSFKDLKYEDIVKIEFNSTEVPEMIDESLKLSKDSMTEEEFDFVIKTLKKNKALKWKKHYYTNYEYMDGGWWDMEITFNNNFVFRTSGDIKYPKKFCKFYKSLEKYIVTTIDGELWKPDDEESEW